MHNNPIRTQWKCTMTNKQAHRPRNACPAEENSPSFELLSTEQSKWYNYASENEVLHKAAKQEILSSKCGDDYHKNKWPQPDKSFAKQRLQKPQISWHDQKLEAIWKTWSRTSLFTSHSTDFVTDKKKLWNYHTIPNCGQIIYLHGYQGHTVCKGEKGQKKTLLAWLSDLQSLVMMVQFQLASCLAST